MSDERGAILVFVPGLRADERLFAPQIAALPWPSVVVKWLDPVYGETLEGYSRRLAEAQSVANPLFLIGISLGGMVALEMSRWLRPEAVLLIASARSGQAIHPFWRAAGRVMGWIPLRMFRLAVAVAGKTSPILRELDDAQRDLCRRMSADVSPRFVRWACGAVARWPGMETPQVPVYHIHGDRDPIMPLHRVHPDRVIHGGGHMINLTHAGEVNAYLKEKIEQTMNKYE